GLVPGGDRVLPRRAEHPARISHDRSRPDLPAHGREDTAGRHAPAGGGRPGPGCQLGEPAGRVPEPSRSLSGSSSTLTSLNVTTRTEDTKRAGRYMSQTQASPRTISKYVRPSSSRASILTSLAR